MASRDMHCTTREVSEIFLKTRKCRYFGMGKCTRGLTFNFAHTTSELRPRLNLMCTKWCPALLKTGSCMDVGCYYAHRREEMRGRRKQRWNSQKSTEQSDTCYPNTLPSLFENTSLQPGVDSLMVEPGDFVAKVNETCDAHMVETPQTDDVALADSLKDLESSKVFAHHGLRVIVKNTFIDVVHAAASLPGGGMTRSSSAPGSINVECTVQWTISL
eukprot:TRINITY_DN10835_c0_g3_i1.p1 TRINITY_DN10835_c0_g3~~TRINITY_DN10835_c0_g3_i1.p1  ORF type:complete len:216 (+),score=26.55 TRINITY_DN10835_c0_g3_i1:91-738(+)